MGCARCALDAPEQSLRAGQPTQLHGGSVRVSVLERAAYPSPAY